MQQPVRRPNMSVGSVPSSTNDGADVVVARQLTGQQSKTPTSTNSNPPEPIALDAIQSELHKIIASSDTEQNVTTRLVDISCRLTNCNLVWSLSANI